MMHYLQENCDMNLTDALLVFVSKIGLMNWHKSSEVV